MPWLKAIEKRLASTAKALGAMKGLKMSGLAATTSYNIANLRSLEIRSSRRYRILNIFAFVIGKHCSQTSNRNGQKVRAVHSN